MAKETTLHKHIRKAVTKLGCRYEKNHGSQYQRKGRLDIEILVPVAHLPYPVTLYVEAKQPGKKPTPAQCDEIEELLSYGALAFWVIDVAQVLDVITALRTPAPLGRD